MLGGGMGIAVDLFEFVVRDFIRSLQYQRASKRYVGSLSNWMKGFGILQKRRDCWSLFYGPYNLYTSLIARNNIYS